MSRDSAAASAIAAATAAVAASGVQQPVVAPRPPIIDDYDDDAYRYEEEEYDLPAPEAVALDIFAQYAGGATIPPGARQQWVLRALNALEAHYHGLRKDDRKRRTRLEKLTAELTQRLEETAGALVAERKRRETAETDLGRAKAALDAEAALSAGLQTHDAALRRSQTAVEREREQYLSALEKCQAQLAETHDRWQHADAAARHWSQRALEAQHQAQIALQEGERARAAKVALQKCLIREKDYQLSEEAGYRLDAIVQIAPTHPSITVFGGPGGRAQRFTEQMTRPVVLDPWKKGTL